MVLVSGQNTSLTPTFGGFLGTGNQEETLGQNQNTQVIYPWVLGWSGCPQGVTGVKRCLKYNVKGYSFCDLTLDKLEIRWMKLQMALSQTVTHTGTLDCWSCRQ